MAVHLTFISYCWAIKKIEVIHSLIIIIMQHDLFPKHRCGGGKSSAQFMFCSNNQ